METIEYDDSELDVDLIRSKFISAVKDENEDVVRSLLDEIFNTSFNPVKSWNMDSYFEKQEKKYELWKKAVFIAMEKSTKHSEEILKLLIDFVILLSLEAEIGNDVTLLHRLIRFSVEDKTLRLTETLLKSGKINVNARDKDGSTAMHWAQDETLLSLLIRYGADVNRKNNEGQTPLVDRCMWRLQVRTILEVAGTLLDLDARDCSGRTALMYGVMENKSDAVELLLNAGASVNLSDHLGFTALHHALFMTKFGDRFLDYDYFPRNSEELKKRKDIFAILFDAIDVEGPHQQCDWYKILKEWNERRMKIVEMLLQRPDIDVNALSIEKFSPLDIAEGWIPQLPSSIRNALKEKGAVLNVFRQTESESKSEFHLDFRCRLILQRHLYQIFEDEVLDLLKERFLTLFKTFREQILTGKDQLGRTALHLVAITFSVISGPSRKAIKSSSYSNHYEIDLANTIVEQLLSLGLSINATDLYGRTPLHYADDAFQELLLAKGADASIKDEDGKCAIDETSRSNDDQVRSSQIDIIYSREELCSEDFPEFLWGEGEYAFCHPLVQQITEEVRDLINAISKEIERLDPRFENRPEFVGSSNEGTRLDKPDEFDFCFVLTKISELCEVSQSPELPTGFVRLKRKPAKIDEDSDFDSFFEKDEILNTEKLNWHFSAILSNAIANTENQQSFEWKLNLQKPGLEKAKGMATIITACFPLKKVSNIAMIKPLNSTSVYYISVDIVPCIHIDDWWPDEAISDVRPEIKKIGCNLIFDGPHKPYPWVPYSESCARISFSKGESDMIKYSCANARQAYMIGKMIIEKAGPSFKESSKYILKNCLLYCIEALTPTSEKAYQLGLSLEEMEIKFHKMNRYLWLKCLMKCHLEFVSRDFCPCYFLPNFSSEIPIGKEYLNFLKASSSSWLNAGDGDFAKACKEAYALYRCTSHDTCESCCQLPTPDPLWERFDRSQLIASLCDIAYK